MWAWPEWARNQLAQSHTATSRLDVLRAGRPVFTLEVVSGEVTAEANRTVMRNASAVVVDPSGYYTDDDIADDLLSPYDCEVAPYRGVVHPYTRQVEYAPLGVFRLTKADITGDGSVRLIGQDRAIRYQRRLRSPVAINGNTPVEEAIFRLLSSLNSGITMQPWKTGFTCGPLYFQADIDAWAEAQKLAASAGGILWHTRTGELIFGPGVYTSLRPVDRYAAGDGRLINALPSDVSDGVTNGIWAESTNTTNGAVIRGYAEDNDPLSPTYAKGSYGLNVDTITNPYIRTQNQADQAAMIEVQRRIGKAQTTSWRAVVDPCLDPWDVVTLHRPEVGLSERPTTTARIRTPLNVEDPMDVVSHRATILRDGRVIQEVE